MFIHAEKENLGNVGSVKQPALRIECRLHLTNQWIKSGGLGTAGVEIGFPVGKWFEWNIFFVYFSVGVADLEKVSKKSTVKIGLLG